MILTVRQRFEVDLPSHWRELPPAHIMASDDWLFEWVDETLVSVDHKESLIASLRDAVSFAGTKMVDGRAWVAVIDSTIGIVRAIASIDTIELTDEVFPDYASLAVPEYPLAGAIPLYAQTAEAVLAGHPAIIVHEIGGYNFDIDGPVIAERYVGTVFPDEAATAVRLEVLAGDLSTFDDIVESCNAVLDGLRQASADLD